MKHNFNLDTIRKFISDNEYRGIPENAEDLYTTANAVTNLLLEPLDINIYNRKWPWDEFWLDQQAQMYPKLKIMLSGPLKNFALFFLYQVNRNWLSSRNFLIYILTHKDPAPDLTYLLINIIVEAYTVDPSLLQDQRSLACQQLFADKLKILLSTDQEWQRVMNLDTISIKDMGGFRNTMLNLYKEELEDIEPWQDSDNYWDIGGGHHTPWISQHWNKPFTSLDIIPPNDYKGITFRNFENNNKNGTNIHNLAGSTLEEYCYKLEKQPWKYYDIFEHQLPTSARTTVVSTGFIGSTVIDINWKTHSQNITLGSRGSGAPPGPHIKAVALIGILGCVQLAHQGLDLELITVSRPSIYATMRRVVHLRWQQGKLIMNNSKPHDTDNPGSGVNQMTYKRKEKKRQKMIPSTTFWENIQC